MIFFVPPTTVAQAAGHDSFVGPALSFMPRMSKVGKSTTGVPFDVLLTDGGKTVSTGTFQLTIPGLEKPVTVTFDGLAYSNGSLTAKAHVTDTSGSVIEGLRLDCVGATETYTAKQADGSTKPAVKDEAVTMDSPLLMGDLQPSDDSGNVDLAVSGITFDPSATKVDVQFKLSGLYLVKELTPNEDYNATDLSVDKNGDVYSTEKYKGVLFIDHKTFQVQPVAKFGDSTSYASVNPLTLDVVGTDPDGHFYRRYSASGDDLGKYPATGDLGHWARLVRFTASGDMYTEVEETLIQWKNGQIVRKADTWGSTTLNEYSSFDVNAAGTAVFVGDGGVFETPADWKTSRKVTFGPDWRLGRVTNVSALRYDSQGNLYIGENRSDDRNERGRISVFDASGHFVRVFGRGGLKVNSDTRLPGQVGDTMWDIATSPDGRIYVNASLNDEHLFVFQTF